MGPPKPKLELRVDSVPIPVPQQLPKINQSGVTCSSQEISKATSNNRKFGEREIGSNPPTDIKHNKITPRSGLTRAKTEVDYKEKESIERKSSQVSLSESLHDSSWNVKPSRPASIIVSNPNIARMSKRDKHRSEPPTLPANFNFNDLHFEGSLGSLAASKSVIAEENVNARFRSDSYASIKESKGKLDQEMKPTQQSSTESHMSQKRRPMRARTLISKLFPSSKGDGPESTENGTSLPILPAEPSRSSSRSSLIGSLVSVGPETTAKSVKDIRSEICVSQPKASKKERPKSVLRERPETSEKSHVANEAAQSTMETIPAKDNKAESPTTEVVSKPKYLPPLTQQRPTFSVSLKGPDIPHILKQPPVSVIEEKSPQNVNDGVMPKQTTRSHKNSPVASVTSVSYLKADVHGPQVQTSHVQQPDNVGITSIIEDPSATDSFEFKNEPTARKSVLHAFTSKLTFRRGSQSTSSGENSSLNSRSSIFSAIRSSFKKGTNVESLGMSDRSTAEKTFTDSIISIRSQTESMMSQMKSYHSNVQEITFEQQSGIPGSSTPSCNVTEEIVQKSLSLSAIANDPVIVNQEKSNEKDDQFEEFKKEFSLEHQIIAKQVIEPLQPRLLSLKDLENLFHRDYSFLDERASNQISNSIMKSSRNMDYYKFTKVEPISWDQMYELINNFVRLQQHISAVEPIMNISTSKLLLKLMADRASSQDAINSLRQSLISCQHLNRLKVYLKHLERLCTCFEAASGTLHRPLSIILAPILFKAAPILGVQIKGLETGNQGAPSSPTSPSLSSKPSRIRALERMQTGSSSPSPVTPGIRSSPLSKPLLPSPLAITQVTPASSPFAPKTKEELEEIEFENWSRKKAMSDRRPSNFVDLISTLVSANREAKQPKKKATLTRGGLAWEKLRHIFRTIGAQAMQETVAMNARIAAEEAARKALVGLEFSDNITKEALGSKLFVEHSCQTALSAGLEFILLNLDDIFIDRR